MTSRAGQKYTKRVVKRGLQHVAASLGRHTYSNKENQLLVLMYHRILPVDDFRTKTEEPGMVVTPDVFREHINLLRKFFTIIKLSDWIQLKQDCKKLPAKACAITFDDGWSDNFDFAFPILQETNAPATIYLVSSLIGTDKVFWPERLFRLLTDMSTNYPNYWSHPQLEWIRKNSNSLQAPDNPPNREQLSILASSLKKFSDPEINDQISRVESALQLESTNYPPSLLDWQQVKLMMDSGLVDFGSHTCNHIRLNEETPLDLAEKEIIQSKKEIEQNTGKTINTFCFPNGDYSHQTLELVKQNYISAVTTNSGWNTESTDVHALRRIGVHQDVAQDKVAFLARISGWM